MPARAADGGVDAAINGAEIAIASEAMIPDACFIGSAFHGRGLAAMD